MPFTSNSLTRTRDSLKLKNKSAFFPVELLGFLEPRAWRRHGCLRGLLLWNLRSNPMMWLPWLEWHLSAFMLRWLLNVCWPRTVAEDLLSGPRPGNEMIMATALSLLARLTNSGRNPAWNQFWTIYSYFGEKDRFCQNYMEAWWQRIAEEQLMNVTNAANPNYSSTPNTNGVASLIVFRDSSQPTLIPCHWNMTDQQLIKHIRNFYYLDRFKAGFLTAFSLKTISYIEVVKLSHYHAPGDSQYDLDLGRHGSGNRLVRFWLQPHLLSGTDLIDRLIKDRVLGITDYGAIGAQAAPVPVNPNPQQAASQPRYGDHEMAINIVENWSTEAGAVVVGLPLVISLLFCIVWSAVAVAVFGADVNMSTQTGFTIGSYVVTAGALLIALVAFLDTQNAKIKT